MNPKKNEKVEIKPPEMNPAISRDEALADAMRWAEKYRLNPRQRLQEFKFSRPIEYNGQLYDVPLLYQNEIYGRLQNIKNLFLAVQKARQSRISEFAVNTMFYLCDKFPGFTLLYVFPDDTAGRRFLIKRVDEPINDSDYLAFMVSSIQTQNTYRARSKSSVDSLDIKKMGLSWFYMLASKSKSASRSPDADAVIFDEYDIHDMEKEESFLSTTDDSNHRTKIYISTPTEPNFGIVLRYNATSMGRWVINCGQCFEDFEMDSEYFFGPGIQKLDTARETDDAERIFVCPHCGYEITPLDKQARGRWVHKAPAMLRYNRVGYQFSNLILPHITADVAWNDYKDFTVKPGGRKRFYNEKLGEPQTDDERNVRFTRDGMLKCCNSSVDWTEQAYGTLMGVDWGKDTHVVIWKHYDGKLRLINYYEFPNEKKPLENARKVAKLMPQYNPRVLVTDYGGGQEQNKFMFEKFSQMLFMAVNKPTLKDMNPVWDKKVRRVYYELITAYSTYARWYPAEMIELPRHDEKLELFIKHHTNSVLIYPNENKTVEGKLVIIGKDEPQGVGHTGPIHVLSAALFAWLDCMGISQSQFHFSDAPVKQDGPESIRGGLDLGNKNNQNKHRLLDKSGATIWRP